MVNQATLHEIKPLPLKQRVKKGLKRYFGMNAGSVIFNILNYILLTVFALAMLYPFYYVLETSLKVHDISGEVAVVKYNFSAYVTILNNDGLVQSFLLSILTVAASTVIHVAFTMLAAYPLSRKHFRGRVAFLLFILFTMLFSGGLIPYYLLITKDLKLQDNILVYIIPGAVGGFNIIIVKNFLQTIPESLEESAKIDGANDLRILISIFIPLSLPIIATIALWHAVGKWNDWMTGVLYVRDKNLRVIQNFLRDILITASSSDGQGVVDPEIMNMAESVKMAAIVIGTLPIILIYPFVQKYFVKGVLLGSVKG